MKAQENPAAMYICFIPMSPHRRLRLHKMAAHDVVFLTLLPKIPKPPQVAQNHHKPKPQTWNKIAIFTSLLSLQNFPQKY